MRCIRNRSTLKMNVRNCFRYGFVIACLAVCALNACVRQDSVPVTILEFSALGLNIFLPGSSVREKLTFDASINQIAEKDGRTLIISGVGNIRYGKNLIEVSNQGIIVNAREIHSADRQIQNFILQEDGDLQPGFIRTFW